MKSINKIRKSPFDDEWVMYAPNRAQVRSISDKDVQKQDVIKKNCPFCPGSEEVGGSYDILILPNKYPSFNSNHNLLDCGNENIRNGYGKQDVFLFNDQHDEKLVNQTSDRIAELFLAIGRRIEEHYEDPKIKSVVAFENSGSEFGPSIKHPHGQIFALPFVPKRMFSKYKQCIICDFLQKHSYNPFIIESFRNALLVCPPYARFPYEMHIMPTEHIASLSNLNETTLYDLAKLVNLGLKKLSMVDSNFLSYMLLIYVAPRCYLKDYHLRIEIIPINKPFGGKKYLGGLELGFGVYVNPSIPENIAKELRKLKVV